MKRLFAIFFATSFFISCGNDSSTEINETVENTVVDITENVSGSYKCTGRSENDQVIVYCNGDSIGVFKNGEKGAKGAEGDSGARGEKGPAGKSGEDGSDCSIVSVDSLNVKIKCGSDSSFTISIADLTALNLTLKGFSQKGPYVKGAKVMAYELKDGNSLMQTGNVFSGEIAADDGFFDISSVTLASQYVILDATGYYLNEVTGEKSEAEINLNALTDLSDRSTANVNLLTHLEYERTYYLVTKEGMSVKKAKKQSEQEIFEAFGIDASGFAYSEDLNIFELGDGNGALLAVSVLLQGNHSVGELSDLLKKISDDMKKDGVLSESIKTTIADDFLKLYAENELATIRTNVKSWNLGPVPEFEKYVENFIAVQYGMPQCDAKTEGTAREMKNAASRYQNVHFVCDDGKWRVTSEMENYSKNYCLSSNEGSEMELLSASYVCAGHAWRMTSNGKYGTLFDERDGRVYNTTEIDGKVWMAENLHYSDSVAVPSLKSVPNSEGTPSICVPIVYSASQASKEVCASDTSIVAGLAYTTYALFDCGYGSLISKCKEKLDTSKTFQGLCPDGWHMATSAEWLSLGAVVGASNIAGLFAKVPDIRLQGKDYDEGTDEVGLSLFMGAYYLVPTLLYDSSNGYYVMASSKHMSDNSSYTFTSYFYISFFENENGSVDKGRFGNSDPSKNSYTRVRCVKD